MKKEEEKSRRMGMSRRAFLKGGAAVGIGAAATMGVSGKASAQSGPAKYSGEMIDIFCHIMPPKFLEALEKKSRPSWYNGNTRTLPALWDLDLRWKAMDKYPGMLQLLDLGMPTIEYAVPPKDAVDLARIANNEMAELVVKYPARFVGAVACLPMSDVDASLREADRAMKDLKFKGIQIGSSINGKPLDRPEYMPLYEKMVEYDLPIWIHPIKDDDIPDYPDEKKSEYRLFSTFAWPFETTKAMGRLVYGGVLEKFPNLKVIPHHCGAMVPFFRGRINPMPSGPMQIAKLTKHPLAYFKKFYGDTVMGGTTSALMCGYDFFGPDLMVFATDYPYPGGAEKCDLAIGDVIESVQRMPIPLEDKGKIFSKNPRKLLKLA